MDQELKNISTRLDKLIEFIRGNMLTKHELAGLRADLPTKAEFAKLQTSVDDIAKGFKTSEQELKIVSERTTRMEAWIQRAADEIGVEYRP
jgi:hypothetical protein